MSPSVSTHVVEVEPWALHGLFYAIWCLRITTKRAGHLVVMILNTRTVVESSDLQGEPTASLYAPTGFIRQPRGRKAPVMHRNTEKKLENS